MDKPKVVAVGEVLWDLFPDEERFGGAPANFACHAAIQGADVTMVSAVGDDQRGRQAVQLLSGFGIDVRAIQVLSDAPTGTVGIELDENGKPSFTIHEGSAWDQIAWHEAIAECIASANAVCFGTLGQRSEVSQNTIRRAVEAAAIAGIPRLVDINLRSPFFCAEMIRESIRLASVLKLSDEELGAVISAYGVDESDIHEDQLRRLLDFSGLDAIVMTRGAEGALLVSAGETVSQNGIPVEVVDTVGAGDSFTAAFLIGLLTGKSSERNLRDACEVAAAACAHAGAVPS